MPYLSTAVAERKRPGLAACLLDTCAILALAVLVAVYGVAALAAPLRVEIYPCGPLEAGEVRFAAVPDETSSAEPVSGIAEPPGRELVLDLDPARPWTVHLESVGFWADSFDVPPGTSSPVRVPAWPRSILAGRLVAPEEEELPEGLMVHFGAPAAEAGRPEPLCRLTEAWTPCGVPEGGELACSLPAGRWNLRLKAPGYAAHHLWKVDLSAGDTKQLGPLDLRHGATLIGEVTTSEGPADPRLVRVGVLPLTAEGAPRELTVDLARQLGATTTLNDQGFFVFEDLHPGVYAVVAHHVGYAPTRLHPVELVADHETALREPLLVVPYVELAVEVRPPADSGGRPWSLTVEREGEGGELRAGASGVTDGEGRWSVSSLEPGRYHLAVDRNDGARMLRAGPFPVAGGEEVFLPLVLDLVEVAGEVLLGDEPLPEATLWFGGRFGEQNVEVEADAEGAFRAVLPRAGGWRVEVEADDPPVLHKGYRVRVPERGGEVVVRLPDTLVSGSVETEAGGVPLSGTPVRLFRSDTRTGSLSTGTDAEGLFELRGIEPGSYLAAARSAEGESDVVPVVVAEDSASPEVRLVLRQRRPLDLRLLSAAGDGVPGARVEAVPLAGGSVLGMGTSGGTTDGAGNVRLEVPGATDTLQVTALPPGFGLTAGWVPAAEPRIRAARPEGSLRLVGDGSRSDGSEVEVVLVDGVPVDRHTLVSWSLMNGGDGSGEGGLTVPAMPAGAYRYCVVAPAELPLLFARVAAPVRCSEGMLTPGGHLELLRPGDGE